MHSDLARTPRLFRRLGAKRAPAPSRLSAEDLQFLRTRLTWRRNSWLQYFASLRPFLRWVGNSVAEEDALWRPPAGEPSVRRWLDEAQLGRLLDAAQGIERAVVALEGFNGLRRIEVVRLRVQDVDLAGRRMHVRGKGRGGGKWRTIPLTATAYAELLSWMGSHPRQEGSLLERSIGQVDWLVRRAGRRAQLGVPVSNHDLRRAFGRIAYRSEMPLVDLRNMLGHQSVDMTLVYIGVEEDAMREGLDRFEARMAAFRAASTPPSSRRGEPQRDHQSPAGTRVAPGT